MSRAGPDLFPNLGSGRGCLWIIRSPWDSGLAAPRLRGLAAPLAPALRTRPRWRRPALSCLPGSRFNLGSISALTDLWGCARQSGEKTRWSPAPPPTAQRGPVRGRGACGRGTPSQGSRLFPHPGTSSTPRSSIPRPGPRPSTAPTPGAAGRWGAGMPAPQRRLRAEPSRTGVCPPPQAVMTPKTAGVPDGGWGWVVAAAAFAVNGLSYGVLRSLGLALPDLAEHFDRSAQDTAWVSALALAMQQAASEGDPKVGGGTRWVGREWGGQDTHWKMETSSRKEWVLRSRGGAIGPGEELQARQQPMRSVGEFGVRKRSWVTPPPSRPGGQRPEHALGRAPGGDGWGRPNFPGLCPLGFRPKPAAPVPRPGPSRR